MTVDLALTILGLALLDSVNPATIVAVTLILLAAPRRAGLIALAAVAGSAITVFIVGAALFLSAGAAAGAVDGIINALRFLAFGAAGLALVISGLQRFKDRPRKAIMLPVWFTPTTAFPFGALLTAADLPNAFPYFIAIERMVASSIEPISGLLVILGYTLIYCLPCLVLLVVGTINRERTRAWLSRIVTRFATGTIERSIPIAMSLIIAGIAVGSIPFWPL